MRYVVVDLETTGLDITNHSIVEFGALLVDEELAIISSLARVVRPPGMTPWDTEALKMHSANGLKDEAERSRIFERDLDVLAFDWLSSHRTSEDESFILAGSGVSHFDHPWLRVKMPRFESLLTYYDMDVGHVRRFAVSVCGHPNPLDGEPKPHRAMGDAMLHLRELQAWHEILRKV